MLADWVGAQGQVNLAKKNKTPPLVTSSPEIPKSKTKNVVFRLQFSLYNKHSNQKALQF